MDTTIFRAFIPTSGASYKTEIQCPHCDTFSSAKGIDLGAGYLVTTCLKCKKSVLVITTVMEVAVRKDPSSIVDYYPKRTLTVNPFVPEEMARDYMEAQRCFSVAAWQACSVMARRCMHLIAEHFQAKGKDLYQQIEDLRNRQLITPVLADAAQRVRALGKHGAHPYDGRGNPFNELNMEDAVSALGFCEFLFDQLFIQPAKIKISQSKVR